MFRLENDIMSEMETRRAVPAASEAAPRHEYRAPPRNEKDRIALSSKSVHRQYRVTHQDGEHLPLT